MDREQPLTRTDFSTFRTLQTRWNDNDIYGHLNNTVHYQLFDTAVNDWLIEEGLLDPVTGALIGLVVSSHCSYFAALKFPEPITAGLRVSHLGTSSASYQLALFGASDTAAAQGGFTHVFVDASTRRPVPLPDHWRAVFGKLHTAKQPGP